MVNNMNPQYRVEIKKIWKCRKCHKDFNNYPDASKCCTKDEELIGDE